MVVYPEPVPPSEWMPHVWGQDRKRKDAGQLEATAAALIAHYNGIARTLAQEPEQYIPVLEVDECTQEIFWKAWMIGFARAMRLRPGTRERIEGSDNLDLIETVEVIHQLYAAATGTSGLTEEGLELLDNLAPMLIGGWRVYPRSDYWSRSCRYQRKLSRSSGLACPFYGNHNLRAVSRLRSTTSGKAVQNFFKEENEMWHSLVRGPCRSPHLIHGLEHTS